MDNLKTDIQALPMDFNGEISSSEMLEVEFKESYAESNEIRETMIAFANAIGGRIYVGVREVSKQSGLHVGKVIGVKKPGISDAASNTRQWAGSFIPKLDFLFNAYQINGDRVDVIEVKESSQKPVCSSAGLYKIRTSDGNTGIDPARLRQMIVGYESFKRALLCECTENLVLLSSIRAYSVAKPPQASLNELTYSTIDAILANGTLSSFFNILALNEVRRLCVQINKLLDFAVSAGGVIIEAQVFYDKINELCPVLQAKITDLLSKLGG